MTTSTQPARPGARLRRPAGPREGVARVGRLTEPGAGEAAVETAAVQSVLALHPHSDLTLVVDPVAGVHAWATRFAQAVVEVAGGDRPVSQLVRWTSPRVYADLDRRATVLAATRLGARARTVRPQVQSVHVSHPAADTAEVSVHVRYGRRSRALAARLELRRGRWTCTALELG